MAFVNEFCRNETGMSHCGTSEILKQKKPERTMGNMALEANETPFFDYL